ncbi:MAG: glycosyltransferase family 87 protein [Promethearchaeia archaeon]
MTVNDKRDIEESPSTTGANGDEEIPFRYMFPIIILVHFLSIILLRFVGNSMYPFFIVVYFLIASYIVFLVVIVAKFGVERFHTKLGLTSHQYIVLILVLTASFRLAFLGSEVSVSLDPLWYLDFGKFMMQGNMPYADFYFPYPPVFAYFIYPIALLCPSVDAFRLLAIIFDVLIVGVLWMISTRRPRRSPLELAPLAYALFPLSIIESGVNGHFEPISNLFLLLAIILILDAREKEAGAMLGLSIATKIYAAFLLPLLLPLLKDWRKRLTFVFSTAIVGFLTFVPFTIPVWLRGDMIFPGTSLPGSPHSGFLGGLFDAIPTSNVFDLGLTILVGIGILAVSFLIVTYVSKRINVREAFGYDISTLLLGVIFLVMALIAGIYPFTLASQMVFWRYPADIGIVRGILTTLGAVLLIRTAWRRWRNEPNRQVSTEQVIFLISTVVLVLVTLFTDVFYGWYLLWCIPPLILLRDRKVVLATAVCLLFIYPSYTHDNFASLGFQENRIWYDEFDSTTSWNPALVTHGNIPDEDLGIFSYSRDGIGQFVVNASAVENQSKLNKTWAMWEHDVFVYVEPRDEFVTRISVNWDPTFQRYADVAINFTGYDSEGQPINGTLLPRGYSPTNLTSVLWRRSLFRVRNVTFPLRIDRIRLIVYPLMARCIEVSIDTMYLTEYQRIHAQSFFLIPLLLGPNMMAVYLLYEYAYKKDED